jgi:hypothetical protein
MLGRLLTELSTDTYNIHIIIIIAQMRSAIRAVIEFGCIGYDRL